MRLRSNIFPFLVVICTTLMLPLNGQTLSDFRNRLEYEKASDPFNNATVTIREDNSSRLALTELELQERSNSVDGFRVGVFFDNGASARANAEEVEKQFNELFPDIPTTMSYDNPYFKVSAGYCINSEEAIILLNRIQKHFPKSYLMRETITTSNIIKRNREELEEMKQEERIREESSN
ncbi:MAG: hypothetical protein SNH55_07200 [Rikenellaceae bacterium]